MHPGKQHIAFENSDSVDRVSRLQKLFDRLKLAKDEILRGDRKYTETSADSREWTGLLDEKALQWFCDVFDYNSAEGLIWQKLWNLTSPDVRISNPFFNVPGNYDFESMISDILNGEYDLIELAFDPAINKGSLIYEPHAWPFGGTEALVALVESYGNIVYFDSYHEGPHRRMQCAWDSSTAKKLVEMNKGLE